MIKTTRIEDKAYQAIESIRTAELAAPETILFGSHKLQELGELVLPLAWRGKALVLLGGRSSQKSGLADRLQTLLNRYVIEMVRAPGITREPTVPMINDIVEFAREVQPKLVIGLGGGSVIDGAKAVAALTVNKGSVEDYLEGGGAGYQLEQKPLPMLAIPTTAGTGAEMTKNAVISSLEKHYKKSMRDAWMIPDIALIDPALSLHMPSHITAAGGMDAITQLIESCITLKRRPEVTSLSHEGLRNAQLGLSVAYEDPANLTARERLAFVSMLSGVCLANSGLAMAHGIAAALGALHDVPHGLACGILLPHTLHFNRDACQEELQQALGAFLNQMTPTEKTIDDGIQAIESLSRWLQVPPNLKYLSLTAAEIETLAEASMGNSMSGNPITMNPDTILAFLKPLAQTEIR